MDMMHKALDAPTRAAQIIGSTGETVRTAVAGIVEAHADDLVAVFYATLIVDQEASRFLSHKLVNDRLSLSLRRWLGELYGRNTPDIDALIERQKVIGDVHARMRIPIHLVMQAANVLKLGIFRRLRDTTLTRADLWAAVVYTNGLMDLAIEIMSQAFVNGTASRVETDEAYRLFSLGQDISLDKETQRAALLEWSQSVLFAICAAEREVLLSPISSSDLVSGSTIGPACCSRARPGWRASRARCACSTANCCRRSRTPARRTRRVWQCCWNVFRGSSLR